MTSIELVTLGEVADLQWGDTSVTKKSYVLTGDKYPAYSASGQDGFLPYFDYDRTGVILSAIGANAGKTWLATGKWSCIKNTIRFFSKDESVADTRYLYWATQSHATFPLRGSAQPFISQGDAREVAISLPPISEQRAIAATLGALDDKIESNRRTVGKAQELGDALFISLTEEHRIISEVATITMGTSPRGNTLNEAGDGVAFYQGTRDFGFRFPARRIWTTNPIRLARRNDTLMSVRAPVGELNRALDDCCVGRGVAAIHSEKQPSTLYYAMRASRATWEKFQGEGTVFASVNKQDVHGAEIYWIGDHHAERLEQSLSSLDSKIESLETENERLTVLRDALLPALLSGSVRVPAEGAEA